MRGPKATYERASGARLPATEAMLTFLVLGAGIGFVAGVSPGPVLTLVVTETLKSGWFRGAAVAAGPLLADGPIVLIAVTVYRDLPQTVVPAISVVGGVFLLYLAVTNALGARHATLPVASGPRPGARGGLLTGLLARALSPHPYLFWFLVGADLSRHTPGCQRSAGGVRLDPRQSSKCLAWYPRRAQMGE